jgi:hypothetical protein
MKTIERRHERIATTATKLPLIENEQSCDFTGI